MATLVKRIRSLSAGLLIALVSFGPGLGGVFYCVDKVLSGQGQEPFRLGNTPIPKFQGAGASYLDVLILAVGVVLAGFVAVFFQYRAYREEEDFKRKYSIKEKRDFVDKILDDIKESDDL